MKTITTCSLNSESNLLHAAGFVVNIEAVTKSRCSAGEGDTGGKEDEMISKNMTVAITTDLSSSNDHLMVETQVWKLATNVPCNVFVDVCESNNCVYGAIMTLFIYEGGVVRALHTAFVFQQPGRASRRPFMET